MNPEEFRKDLSELVKKIPKIAMFRILGGEPLLHKDINKFLQYSRELLPEISKKEDKIFLYLVLLFVLHHYLTTILTSLPGTMIVFTI